MKHYMVTVVRTSLEQFEVVAVDRADACNRVTIWREDQRAPALGAGGGSVVLKAIQKLDPEMRATEY